MNTSLFKYTLLTLLVAMSSANLQADKESEAIKIALLKEINANLKPVKKSCPLSTVKKLIIEHPIPAATVISAVAILSWVHKFRSRDGDWDTRFDKSKLTTDTLRQVWYFIADEILGHAGEVTKVEIQRVTNDGTYELKAKKEVCAPHGVVGSVLGYANEVLKTKKALLAVAAIVAWINTCSQAKCCK